MEVGQYLKRERELRKIPLEQVADVTKITIRHLYAIEAGQMDQLPNKVFARGFIKQYARCIGLDVDDVMLRYDELATLHSQEVNVPAPEIKQKKKFKLPKIHINHSIIFIIIAAVIIALAAFFSSR